MYLAAVSVELGWDKIGMLLTVLLAIGGGIGVVIYGALKKLEQYLDQEKELKSKASDEIAARYKELYEIEKERTIQSLGRITALEVEMGTLRTKLAEMNDENHRVLTLNMKMQEDKRKDNHEIQNLRNEIGLMKAAMKQE